MRTPRDTVTRKHAPSIERTAMRVISLEVARVYQALQSMDIDDFIKWLYAFYIEVQRDISAAFSTTIRTFFDDLKAASIEEITPQRLEQMLGQYWEQTIKNEMELFTIEYQSRLAERHAQSSYGQLYALSSEPDPKEAITKRLIEWSEKRAGKIVNNELVRGSNGGFLTCAFAANLTVVWKNRGGENCPFCRWLNNQRIVKGFSFVESGQTLKPRGVKQGMKIFGRKMHPPLHRGCDCTLVAV